MENRQQMTEESVTGGENLFLEQKQAVNWFITNVNIAEELSKGDKIPKNEIKSLIAKAINEEDYVMMLLLLHKEAYDNEYMA